MSQSMARSVRCSTGFTQLFSVTTLVNISSIHDTSTMMRNYIFVVICFVMNCVIQIQSLNQQSNHRIFWSVRHRSNEKQAKTHCTHLYIMSPTIRCIISNFIEFYFLLCMVSFKKLLFHIRSVFICVWV